MEEFKHCCKPSEDLIRVGKVLCQRIKSWLAWDEKINSIVQNVSSHCIMGFNNMCLNINKIRYLWAISIRQRGDKELFITLVPKVIK